MGWDRESGEARIRITVPKTPPDPAGHPPHKGEGWEAPNPLRPSFGALPVAPAFGD